MSEEALHIAEKKREAKSKGERKRYTQLNAEFQRMAGRDKKAFLSKQCKDIERENRETASKKKKKLEIQREHLIQRWAQQKREMART